MNNKEGLLIVVSGPSGVGKDTIVGEYMKTAENTVLSVSATTRQPRSGEKNGVEYFFLTQKEFLNAISNGELIEYTNYNGNYYGTLKKTLDTELVRGNNVILVIETDGARQVAESFPHALRIFIVPPSFDELERRIYGRSLDSEEQITCRLKIAEIELEEGKSYPYQIENNNLDDAVQEFSDLIAIKTNEKHSAL